MWEWYYDTKKILVTAALVVTSAVSGCNYFTNNREIGDREIQGQITSFGKDGVFWSTYEGTMAVGGDQRSISKPFSLDMQRKNGENVDSLAKQLYEALRTKKTVRMHEKEVLKAMPWSSGTDYHIVEVEFDK